MKPDLSVLILTHNETLHLRRCIQSVQPFAKAVFIVDSYSSDDTLEIARSLGAEVFQNPWVNYAEQFNWGLENCPITTQWVMRMDADEYATPELQKEILIKLPAMLPEETAVYVKRRVHFMGKWIKRGGYYPTWLLRIWHHEKGFCEKRWMDEHIKVTTDTPVFFEHDLVDDNLNDLTWWTTKHNHYATRELVDLLNIRYNFLEYDEVNPALFGSQEQRKRWLKIKYANLPLFTRPFIYFLYRYFIKLGFLDGTKGLIWHFLQGFWYRFLVDAKVYDIKRRAKFSGKPLVQEIENYLGKPLH
ncbi:Glycosyltransferase involved in cell wall bisynthesis [Algoriphagus faecimaris]|uniref:Glycosyltransferase involved in cell wall bisynthesis n=1 Tax=Algoriphagus faecimaris TaxID=686796 RepID=A0A1G6UAZ2_9BACT|nr:glycosyltransferase family 2 protein [Algoriphagus faecimaris]SDD38560.1 Glycosyltransferase involved in cell wall bisynthesis [Algoriphagus faecimaris]